MNRFKKLMLLASMACLAVGSTVFANCNGNHVNKDNSAHSDIFIVGDSRVAGLASKDKNNFIGEKEKAFSYNATVGAHYERKNAWQTGVWKNKPMMIAYSGYQKQQETIIKNTLKKQKRCFVVIEGTINDVGWDESSASHMVSLAKDFKKISVNGKKPTVVLTTVVPCKGKDSGVKKINNYIKAKAKKANLPVIDLGLNSKWKGKYSGDGTHFTEAGSKQLKKMLYNGIINNTDYYKLSATMKSIYTPVSENLKPAVGGSIVNFNGLIGK